MRHVLLVEIALIIELCSDIRMLSTLELRVIVLVVAIIIMPISSCQIGSDLIVLLCVLDNLHIQIDNGHTFCTASQAHYGPNIRCAHL